MASDWLRHFRLLLWNQWMEFNETSLVARSQHPLRSLCFSGRSKKNKMAALASDLLRHFRLLLWNQRMEFNETWKVARSQRPLPSLCFFRPIEKTRWLPRPLIGWNLWNRYTEFNKTLQKARSQCPLRSVFFSILLIVICTKMAAMVVLSKWWHIVLRCTICGPLGLFCRARFAFLQHGKDISWSIALYDSCVWELSKSPQGRQCPDPHPLWLSVWPPLVWPFLNPWTL